MTNQYDWLIKRTPRSVDQLRLWSENPRLDPNGEYQTMRDFADEITNTPAERKDFVNLMKSVVEKGFIPADPVVVWQHELNKKYYVAEGNRRILALKILRNPKKAPKNIRQTSKKLSEGLDLKSIEKIQVAVAPTFEDAEWYISQRNGGNTLQRPWKSVQEKRWVAQLYDKYSGDISKIRNKTGLTESQLQENVRLLILRDYVKNSEEFLTKDELEVVASPQFPITTFQRFFGFTKVRDAWGITYDGYDVLLTKDEDSFLKSLAGLVKRILLPQGADQRIYSRNLENGPQIDNILQSLPSVETRDDDKMIRISHNKQDKGATSEKQHSINSDKSKSKPTSVAVQKNNPLRKKLIPENLTLDCDSYKLNQLFEELKKIPFTYGNCISSSIRVFLDLAVLYHIKTEDLGSAICKQYGVGLKEIVLKKRIEFVKRKMPKSKASTVLERLTNSENEFSLDVLNGYVHSEDTHYSNQRFLNSFWDFLFPFFEEVLTIKKSDE